MKKVNLMLHAGGYAVRRETLDSIPTPEPTATWHPIPHVELLTGIQSTLERGGYRVVNDSFALAKGGDRFFGLLQLEKGSVADDHSLVLGLRNSHDRSIPAGLVIGGQVFVCDNLSFSGEVRIARKHTVNIKRDLPSLIERAIGCLADVRCQQERRFDVYKRTEITDAKAHDLVIQALDARVVTATRVPDVISEWRNPRHPEFRESKTAWRLFNGFTEVLKGSNLFRRPVATQALHGIVDTACGLN